MKTAPKILLGQCLTMALSVAIAIVVSLFIAADQRFWIPLTTFCVSLFISTPLTALRRTVHRILGSIYGVILAGSVILVWPGLYQSLFFLILFAGLTLWSRAFVSLYYLFVTFMTASVIMLLSILMQSSSITPNYLITERLIFTITGASISLLCSILLMPPLESWNMLKTYRHYLTRFLIDYRQAIEPDKSKEAQSLSTLLAELHRSSSDYKEKLPIWHWQLFFDRFVYRSLARYLHRIYNMRVLASIMLPGVQTFISSPITSSNKSQTSKGKKQILALLHQNYLETKNIVRSLELLKRDNATAGLQKLKICNQELTRLVNNYSFTELKTVMIVIHELEYELEHLIQGPVQHYLCQKKKQP